MTNHKEQIGWLNSTKGVGIILIVLGHCSPPMTHFVSYLYSFHVALFFYLSGFLYNKERDKQSSLSYLSHRFNKLIFPYFVYGLITYVVWLFIGRNFGINKSLQVDPLKPLIGLFYGNGINNYLVFNIALWFLPALFSVGILFHLIVKNIKHKLLRFLIVIACLVLGIIDSRYSYFRLPWGINIAFVAVFYSYIGYVSKNYITRLFTLKGYSFIYFILGLAFLLIGYLTNRLNGGISFNSHSYGNPFISVPSAIFSIIGVVFLVFNIFDCRILQFLGKNSLRIFALHILSFSFTSAIIKYVFKQDFSVFKLSLEGRFIYFAMALLFTSIYSLLINRLSKKLLQKNPNNRFLSAIKYL